MIFKGFKFCSLIKIQNTLKQFLFMLLCSFCDLWRELGRERKRDKRKERTPRRNYWRDKGRERENSRIKYE